jgi:DNA-binding NarL/FixJ family response regulator
MTMMRADLFRSVSALVAEPSRLLCEKTAGLLSRYDRVWCVTQVSDAASLLRAAAILQPELVLADLVILREAGGAVRLHECSPRSRVVALVESGLPAYQAAARRLGASSTLEKSLVSEGIPDEIGAFVVAGVSQGAVA